MCQALLEIMEPEINKIVGEAEEKATKRQAVNTARNMISSGDFSAKEIAKYVPGLTIEEIQTLERELVNA